MDKNIIAEMLGQMASLLDIKGENPFKIRAYENASRMLESLVGDFDSMVKNDEIRNLKGIGVAIAEHIHEIYETGTFEELEKLKRSIPPELLLMLNIQGVGPKKVKFFWKELGITKISELEKACKNGILRGHKGFGEKTEEKILKGIDAFKRFADKHLYPEVASIAYQLVDGIKKVDGVIKVEVAGSIRRKKELIGDIDILCSTTKPDKTMNFFVHHKDVREIIAEGETKSAVLLQSGINADLRTITDKEFPFALHYFTGSKDHNVAMRSLAKRFGLKLNEYGLFDKNEKSVLCKSEEDIFKTLKLQYIPPELREGLGEIEAAQENKIPELITVKDIKGVLHIHSNYSDGLASLEDMVLAAKKVGLSYIGICDHSVSANYAGGLNVEDLKKQWNEIDKLNKKNIGIKILKGIESDIKKDGSLDYEDDILKEFDFIVASIHSSFSMPENEMTARICNALKNPYTSILGHPTGRLLLSRDPYQVNMQKVIECAAKYKKAIEINSYPNRLDLDWRWVKVAKDLGVKIVICPDAHSINDIQYYTLGVNIARKGWCTKNDILNCLSVDEFLKRLKA